VEVHTGDKGTPNAGAGAAAEDFKATALREGERGAGRAQCRKGGKGQSRGSTSALTGEREGEGATARGGETIDGHGGQRF
jgi:hypothetical protein